MCIDEPNATHGVTRTPASAVTVSQTRKVAITDNRLLSIHVVILSSADWCVIRSRNMYAVVSVYHSITCIELFANPAYLLLGVIQTVIAKPLSDVWFNYSAAVG